MPAPSLVSRRAWVRLLGGGTALIAVGARPGRAAAAAPLKVAVAGKALEAIVRKVGGAHISVVAATAGASGDGLAIRLGDTDHPTLPRNRLKGTGPARARYLDDARFAPTVSAAVRDALSAADPAHAEAFKANHKAWSRPFALQVVKWTKRLKTSKLAGKRLSDPYGRIYLLTWAGAKVDPSTPDAGPAGLASLPGEPASADLAAYKAYIDRLVDAVG